MAKSLAKIARQLALWDMRRIPVETMTAQEHEQLRERQREETERGIAEFEDRSNHPPAT